MINFTEDEIKQALGEHSALAPQLKRFKLSGMLERLVEQEREPAYAAMTFWERFTDLVACESQRRDSSAAERLLKACGLEGDPANLLTWKPDPAEGTGADLLANLRSCAWVRNGMHLIITGSAASRKTELLRAVVHQCCLNQIRTLRYEGITLEADLSAIFKRSDTEGSAGMAALIDYICGYKVLAIEDFLAVPMSEACSSMFFNLIKTYHGSLVLSSVYSRNNWEERMGVKALAQESLIRIKNRAIFIELADKKPEAAHV